MASRALPVVAFTMGDPGGVGPELLARCLRHPEVRRSCVPLVVGARRMLERDGWRPSLAPLLDPGVSCRAPRGRPTAEGGAASFAAVRLAFRLYSLGRVGAIVTAPVSKKGWALAGVPVLDHTTFFEKATQVADAGMMLLAGGLRAILATRHVAFKEVPGRLSSESVRRAARQALSALRALGVASPRVGLCALNPHAGEEGLLGAEERRVLAPAARGLRGVFGPLPADAAWAAHARGRYDALVALYHDQALIPLKTVDPFGVVNWTVGLPLVRTSPGHGTAYDLAGKRKADPKATVSAALLAASLARAALLLALLAARGYAQQALSATELVDRANKVLRGESSHGSLTMTIVTPSWTRSLDIEGWNQGREKAFIVIHAPPKDKGNTTLRRKSEMWLWMPKVERVVKVPPTMMHSSWQGSDFTYEDIVKADSIVKDYSHKVVQRKPAAGYESYKIEALPKPDAPVVWGKVLFWARLYPDSTVLPEREEDYNERGELIRTITLSEIEAMGGRRIPTRLECLPTRKRGQRTVMKYHRIEFDVPLADDFFSLERLQRSR